MLTGRPLIILAFLAVLALILYGGFKLHKPLIGLLAAAAVTAGLWVAVERAIRADYRDADGYSDCWPNCTPLQDGVGTINAYAPVALILLAAGLAVFLGFARWRGRRPETS